MYKRVFIVVLFSLAVFWPLVSGAEDLFVGGHDHYWNEVFRGDAFIDDEWAEGDRGYSVELPPISGIRRTLWLWGDSYWGYLDDGYVIHRRPPDDPRLVSKYAFSNVMSIQWQSESGLEDDPYSPGLISDLLTWDR